MTGNLYKLTSFVTRRAFLGWMGKGVSMVALGGLIRLSDPKNKFRRPPRAAPEEEFLSLCTRCMKCQDVCPDVIVPVLITESIVAAGTPKLPWPCPRCMKCIPVCPTGALRGYG